MVPSLGPPTYQHINPQQTWQYNAPALSAFPPYANTLMTGDPAMFQNNAGEIQGYGWPNASPQPQLGGDDQMLPGQMMDFSPMQNPYGFEDYL